MPLSETLDHLLHPVFQPDSPTPGQPPSHASQQTVVILILVQDANAASVLQEIMFSLSQIRPAPLQPSPPGQSAVQWPYTIQLGPPTDASPQCPVCRRSFGPPQERNRHALMHLPLWLFCPFQGCPWRGDRSYTLLTHWAERHADFGEAPKPEDCKIYNPDPLVQSVIRGELLIEEMTAITLQAVKIRAQALEKVGIWENEWGRGQSV